jgi:acetyl-CoA C-acetyltransferase
MAEPVIVATARSPIGRAFKGSLVDVRPDDLAAEMVKAALAKVPQLDHAEIDDLMLGCGLPGGEQGFNMGRIVALLAGTRRDPRLHDHPLLLLEPPDHPDGCACDQGW